MSRMLAQPHIPHELTGDFKKDLTSLSDRIEKHNSNMDRDNPFDHQTRAAYTSQLENHLHRVDKDSPEEHKKLASDMAQRHLKDDSVKALSKKISAFKDVNDFYDQEGHEATRKLFLDRKQHGPYMFDSSENQSAIANGHHLFPEIDSMFTSDDMTYDTAAEDQEPITEHWNNWINSDYEADGHLDQAYNLIAERNFKEFLHRRSQRPSAPADQ